MRGAQFRETRVRAGLSFRSCADALGVSLSTVQRWEAEEAALPADAAERILALAGERTGPAAAFYAIGRVAAIVERASGRRLPLSVTRMLEDVPAAALSGLARIAATLDDATRDAIGEALAPVRAGDLDSPTSRSDRSQVWLGYYHERSQASAPPSTR